jgi:hypothetical protein
MDTSQLLHTNDLINYSTKQGSGIYEQGCKTLDDKALTGGFGMTPDQAVVFVQSLTPCATTMGWNTVSKQIITFTNRSGKTVIWNLLACVAGPPLLNTGKLNTITYLFIFLLPIVIISLMHSVLPENPKALRFLMATILRGTPWPTRGHRGPIFCRRRKVNMKLENRNPAIMTAANGDFSRQLIVASFPTDANQVAPATTICDDFFKLIDTSASEGAALCSEGAQPAPTIVCDKLRGHGLIVDFIPTTSNLLLRLF